MTDDWTLLDVCIRSILSAILLVITIIGQIVVGSSLSNWVRFHTIAAHMVLPYCLLTRYAFSSYMRTTDYFLF